MAPLSDLPSKHPFIGPLDGTCEECGMVFDFGALHVTPDPEPEPLKPHNFKPGQVVQGYSGSLFRVEYDRYSRSVRFVPLLPIAASQANPPAGAVLVVKA